MNNAEFFRFKQFNIRHQSGPMKVGTDSVLLGAWAVSKLKSNPPVRVLDVGAGTGILSLMLAQAFPTAQIDALEPDQDALEDLRFNIKQSSFVDKINLIEQKLQDYIPVHKYDTIISNPPYFPGEMKTERKNARSNTFLNIDDIFSFARKYGLPGVRIFIVFPVEQSNEILDAAYSNDFFPVLRTTFRHDQKTPWKRTLWSFSDDYNRDFEEDFITLFDKKGELTVKHKLLTEKYYL